MDPSWGHVWQLVTLSEGTQAVAFTAPQELPYGSVVYRSDQPAWITLAPPSSSATVREQAGTALSWPFVAAPWHRASSAVTTSGHVGAIYEINDLERRLEPLPLSLHSRSLPSARDRRSEGLQSLDRRSEGHGLRWREGSSTLATTGRILGWHPPCLYVAYHSSTLQPWLVVFRRLPDRSWTREQTLTTPFPAPSLFGHTWVTSADHTCLAVSDPAHHAVAVFLRDDPAALWEPVQQLDFPFTDPTHSLAPRTSLCLDADARFIVVASWTAQTIAVFGCDWTPQNALFARLQVITPITPLDLALSRDGSCFTVILTPRTWQEWNWDAQQHVFVPQPIQTALEDLRGVQYDPTAPRQRVWFGARHVTWGP